MTKLKTTGTEQVPTYFEDTSMSNDPSIAILVILEIEAKSMLQDPFVSQLVQVIKYQCNNNNILM